MRAPNELNFRKDVVADILSDAEHSSRKVGATRSSRNIEWFVVMAFTRPRECRTDRSLVLCVVTPEFIGLWSWPAEPISLLDQGFHVFLRCVSSYSNQVSLSGMTIAVLRLG